MDKINHFLVNIPICGSDRKKQGSRPTRRSTPIPNSQKQTNSKDNLYRELTEFQNIITRQTVALAKRERDSNGKSDLTDRQTAYKNTYTLSVDLLTLVQNHQGTDSEFLEKGKDLIESTRTSAGNLTSITTLSELLDNCLNH
tara:strand:- start:2914 stop:3339 length:426 start_codon:yes stop_codon:yes gene_type:complete